MQKTRAGKANILILVIAQDMDEYRGLGRDEGRSHDVDEKFKRWVVKGKRKANLKITAD